jgi:hypothetical protein
MTPRNVAFVGLTGAALSVLTIAKVEVAGQAAAAARPQAAAAAKPANAPARRTPWGAPDLQGLWSTATVTPMERPKELEGKEFLTPEEAADFAKRAVQNRNVDENRDRGSNRDVTGAYNNAWFDYGTQYIRTRRTSLVTDPRDGHIPPLTPAARDRVAHWIPSSGYQDSRNLDSWLDRGLWERCITRGVPEGMLPTAYNNHYRIFQTPDYVAIEMEMIHDARIIPLDGRPHPSADVRQWMGHSVGHWDGDTLVIDTTNFTDKTNFRGAGRNLHLVERIRREQPDLLIYEATIDDPTAFTRPWTFQIPVTPAEGEMYEYACHEGNLSMAHVLAGSRAKEKSEAEAKEKAVR